MRTQGASLVGPHHSSRGEGNQDAYGHVTTAGGAVILAVADGAGSLEHSRAGADRAVAAAMEFLSEESTESPEKLIEQALKHARETLLSAEDFAPKELGCTLTLALLRGDSWAVGAVGDSFGVVHLLDGGHLLVTENDPEAYANITKLLTSETFTPVLLSGDAPLRGLTLSSDGLQHLVIKSGEAHVPFWESFLPQLENPAFELESFFQWLSIGDKLVDDTTLVALTLQDKPA